MKMSTLWKGVAAGTAAGLVYRMIIRPWQLHWGATPAEVSRTMPGDELTPRAHLVSTRAVTIYASPAEIWPWLVQMGYKRAGWYSYERIDNAGVRVDRIIPELQDISVGDILPLSDDGGFRVLGLEPDRSLVLLLARGGTRITVTMLLEPIGHQKSRLVLRLRAWFEPGFDRLFSWVFTPGDFVMMRKMLLGLKERVERHTPLRANAHAYRRPPARPAARANVSITGDMGSSTGDIPADSGMGQPTP